MSTQLWSHLRNKWAAIVSCSLAYVVLLCVCAYPLNMHAQQQEVGNEALTKTTSQSPRAKRVIQLDGMDVEGKIRKPSAFYILSRSGINWQRSLPKQRMLINILRSLEVPPIKP